MFKEKICPCQLKKYDGLKIVEHGKCVGISSLVLKITKTVTEMQIASFYSIYIHCTPISTNYEPRMNTRATAGRKRGTGAKSYDSEKRVLKFFRKFETILKEKRFSYNVDLNVDS